MKIEMYANDMESLKIEIENLKHDYKIKSITYRFNTVEYYKNNPYYCHATVEIH